MSTETATLEGHIPSSDVGVRLRATELLLRHPVAPPLQIVRCLCSEDLLRPERFCDDDRNDTVRLAGRRLPVVEDAEVFEYLEAVFAANPLTNRVIVEEILNDPSEGKSVLILCGRRYASR
jgi:hypothetical protein